MQVGVLQQVGRRAAGRGRMQRGAARRSNTASGGGLRHGRSSCGSRRHGGVGCGEARGTGLRHCERIVAGGGGLQRYTGLQRRRPESLAAWLRALYSLAHQREGRKNATSSKKTRWLASARSHCRELFRGSGLCGGCHASSLRAKPTIRCTGTVGGCIYRSINTPPGQLSPLEECHSE